MLPNLVFPGGRQPLRPCRFRFLPLTQPAFRYSRWPANPAASAAPWTGNATESAAPPARLQQARRRPLLPASSALPKDSGASPSPEKALRLRRTSSRPLRPSTAAAMLPFAFLSLPVALVDSLSRKFLGLPASLHRKFGQYVICTETEMLVCACAAR